MQANGNIIVDLCSYKVSEFLTLLGCYFLDNDKNTNVSSMSFMEDFCSNISKQICFKDVENGCKPCENPNDNILQTQQKQTNK